MIRKALLLLIFIDSVVAGAGSPPTVPSGISIHGVIVNSQGQPEEGSSVIFNVQVVSPGAEDCVLFAESHTLNMQGTGGNFSFILGQGKRQGTGFESTSTLEQIFNDGLGGFTGLTCATGSSYTPRPGDNRKVAISFVDNFGVHTVANPLNVESVPYAFTADNIQGFTPVNFLNLGTTPALTQNNVENIFSETNYSRLSTLLSVLPSQYLTQSSNGTIGLPSDSNVPSQPAAGQIWYNPSSNVIQYYNGTGVQTFATSNGASITNGTIGGTTAILTSGNLQTSGLISSGKLLIYDHTGAGPNYAGLQVPTNIAAGGASYILTLPNSSGQNGQVLTTDGTGLLSWTNRTAGAVTSVTGTSPIVITGSTQAPVLSVNMASTSAPGVVTLAANGGTVAGTSVQGNDSRLSNARAPTGAANGDLGGTYPSPSVVGINGVAVSSNPISSGQVLRYDGAHWTPDFVSMFDLRSTITGSQAFGGVGCSSSQTLTWTAGSDNLVCTNIGIGDSQISYASQNQNLFFAGPTSSAGAPSFRAITAADLPAGAYNSTYFAVGGNALGVNASLGTSDSHNLNLITNGTARLTVLSNGNIGVGVAAPASALVLKAGVATVAPFQLTAGTNLTTPLSGAIEYDGTNLYFTNSTPLRQTVAMVGASQTFSGNDTFTGTVSATSSGTSLAVTNNETVGGTLQVTGASTFTGTTTYNGSVTVGANQNMSMSSGTGTFTQTYTGTGTAHAITASTTTGNAESIIASALTTGNILSLSSTSTTTPTNGSNAGINVSVSGANANATVTRYGVYSSVTSTGSTSTNVGGYFNASGATNNYALVVNSGSVGIDTVTPVAPLDVHGHVANSGSAASLGACGTSPTMAGNDTRGTVTMGTGTVTSCVVNFNATFTTAPICVATWNTSASTIGMAVSSSTSALTVTFSANAAGLKVNYICMQ